MRQDTANLGRSDIRTCFYARLLKHLMAGCCIVQGSRKKDFSRGRRNRSLRKSGEGGDQKERESKSFVSEEF